MKAHAIATYFILVTYISALLSIRSVAGTWLHPSLSLTAVHSSKKSRNIADNENSRRLRKTTIDKRSLEPETVVLFEDFNDSSKFVFKNNVTFFSAGKDYLGIVGLDDFGTNVKVDPILDPVSGFNNENYLVGAYLSGEGASLPIRMEWQDLDISNLSTLKFSVMVASNGNNDIDFEDYIRFRYSIDSGNFQNLLWFETSAFLNSFLMVDADFSGNGDGDAVTEVAKTFIASIGDTGSTLTLQVALKFNNFDEDFAMDEIRITGIPNPPTEAPSAPPSVQPSSSLRPSAHPSAQPSASSSPSLMPSNSPSHHSKSHSTKATKRSKSKSKSKS